MAQFGPAYPSGHKHEYEQDCVFAEQRPPFTHGLELHGLATTQMK